MTPAQQSAANLIFLALAVWKEASDQPAAGQLAVAYSVLTRVLHPRWWGHDLLSVLFDPEQYDCFTIKGDPDLVRWPKSSDPSWDACVQAAQSAIDGSQPNPAPDATSYYDISIPAPAWATEPQFVAAIGRLRFYRVE